MLNKNTCQKCYQKHETPWDETQWQDGYVTCPKDTLNFKHNGKPITIPKQGNLAFLYSIYGQQQTSKLPPPHCDLLHAQTQA